MELTATQVDCVLPTVHSGVGSHPVEDRLAFAFGLHQARPAKHPEMVGQEALLDIQPLGQRTHMTGSAQQAFQNRQSSFVGQN